MCDYCHEDQLVRARAAASDRNFAEALRRLAAHHEALASGRTRPHEGRDFDRVRHTANRVIRRLVEEWV